MSDPRTIFGIPIRGNPKLDKGMIALIPENHDFAPIVEIENESLMDRLRRAIANDPGFIKKCGVIVKTGEPK